MTEEINSNWGISPAPSFSSDISEQDSISEHDSDLHPQGPAHQQGAGAQALEDWEGSRVSPHIQINGHSDFREAVNRALDDIYQVPDGRKLIDEFQGPAQKGNEVWIGQTVATRQPAEPQPSARILRRNLSENQKQAKAEKASRKQWGGLMKGAGASANVKLNPGENRWELVRGLIEARQMVKGTRTNDKGRNMEGKIMARVIGDGKKNRKRISTKSINDQLTQNGLPDLGNPL